MYEVNAVTVGTPQDFQDMLNRLLKAGRRVVGIVPVSGTTVYLVTEPKEPTKEELRDAMWDAVGSGRRRVCS